MLKDWLSHLDCYFPLIMLLLINSAQKYNNFLVILILVDKVG